MYSYRVYNVMQKSALDKASVVVEVFIMVISINIFYCNLYKYMCAVGLGHKFFQL